MRFRAHRITAVRAGYYRGMLLIGTVHLPDWVFQAFDLKSTKAIKHVLDESGETPDATLATFDFGRLSVICSCVHTTALASGGRRLHYSTDVIWFAPRGRSIARSCIAPVSASVRLVPQYNGSDLSNALHPLEGISQAVVPSGLDHFKEQFR
jgi:hypothetical protein